MEFEKRPLDEKLELEPKVELHSDLAFEHVEADLRGAIQAVGEDEVAAALDQVARGEARPEELLAWIDELRDPEKEKAVDASDATPLGFLHDFEADTEIAADETEQGAEGADLDAVDQEGSGGGFAEDDDAHYLFSAVRKQKAGEDDGEGDGGGAGGGGEGSGGGAGGGAGSAAPGDAGAAKAAAKKSKPAKPDKAPKPEPAKPPRPSAASTKPSGRSDQ